MYKLEHVDKYNDTIDEWREKFNRLYSNTVEHINNTGVIDNLVTDSGSAIEQYNRIDTQTIINALNASDSIYLSTFNYSEIVDIVNYLNDTKSLIESIRGNLDDLEVSDKTTLVNALNSVVDLIGTNNIFGETLVGKVNELSSTVGYLAFTRQNLNSVVENINQIISFIGSSNLTELNTSVNDTLINSINSLKGDFDTQFADNDVHSFSISGLKTSKTIVDINNSVFDLLGDNNRLMTQEKDVIQKSIDEMVGEMGDIVSLTTNEKDTMVNAIIEKTHWKNNDDDGVALYTGSQYNPSHINLIDPSDVSSSVEKYDRFQVQGEVSSETVEQVYRVTEVYDDWVENIKQVAYVDTVYQHEYKDVKKRINTWSYTDQMETTHYFYEMNDTWGSDGTKKYRSITCMTPQEAVNAKDEFWATKVKEGWNGPTGDGGTGTGEFADRTITYTKGDACIQKVTRNFVDESYDVNIPSMVDTSYNKNRYHENNESYWLEKNITLDYSKNVQKIKWINNSRYVIDTKDIETPTILADWGNYESGAYIKGNVKADKLETPILENQRAAYNVIGNVTGNIDGSVNGNASGTSASWGSTIVVFMDGLAQAQTIIGDGANKNVPMSLIEEYSKDGHDHDVRNYLKHGESRDYLYVDLNSSNLSEQAAWNTVSSMYNPSDMRSGYMLMTKAGSNKYVWLKYLDSNDEVDLITRHQTYQAFYGDRNKGNYTYIEPGCITIAFAKIGMYDYMAIWCDSPNANAGSLSLKIEGIDDSKSKIVFKDDSGENIMFDTNTSTDDTIVFKGNWNWSVCCVDGSVIERIDHSTNMKFIAESYSGVTHWKFIGLDGKSIKVPISSDVELDYQLKKLVLDTNVSTEKSNWMLLTSFV